MKIIKFFSALFSAAIIIVTIITIIVTGFFIVFSSLNSSFIYYNKTLLISKLTYTFSLLILVMGVWMLLPKKIRILIFSFISSWNRVKLFKYGDPLTTAPVNPLGLGYILGEYNIKIKLVGVILIIASLIGFVYL